jgi:predicted nucleotidyltransferase
LKYKFYYTGATGGQSIDTQFKPIFPDTLSQVLGQITGRFNPKRVILFGSWARGDARPNSDIDLAFELDGKEKCGWDEFFCLMLDEALTLHRLDLVRLDQISADFQSHINTHGLTLYERKN